MNYLIFDGNYILHKSVYILKKFSGAEMYGKLFNLLNNTIQKYANMHSWEKIVIVSDSGKTSWRKKYYNTYKAKRVKDETVDWDLVYQIYNSWKEELINKYSDKYIVMQKDHIEGDDFIAFTTFYANKYGKSCLIITSDNDIKQLIKYDLNKRYINIRIDDKLNSELITLPTGYINFIDEYKKTINNDIFNLNKDFENITFLENLIKAYNINEVSNKKELFIKVIMGDISDNISSIYKTLTSTGKLRNIGEATAEKMWNVYEKFYDVNYKKINEDFKDAIIDCLETVKGKVLKDHEKEQVKNNIELNKSIIELKHTNYPEKILDNILEVMNEKLI